MYAIVKEQNLLSVAGLGGLLLLELDRHYWLRVYWFRWIQLNRIVICLSIIYVPKDAAFKHFIDNLLIILFITVKVRGEKELRERGLVLMVL